MPDPRSARKPKRLNTAPLSAPSDPSIRQQSEQQRYRPFESLADLEEFFRACDALEGPEREPDWQEHLETQSQ